MFAWLRKLLAANKSRKVVDEAINANYATTDKNRTPLDPANDPWRT